MRPIALSLAVAILLSPIAKAEDHPTRTLTAAEKVALQNAVKKQIKDPTSPLFKWPELELTGGKDGVYNYCGLVNAKNSYGAYIGFVPYYAALVDTKGKPTAFLMSIADGDSSDADSQTTLALCHKYGYFM
jgi:hypothetical protein